MRAGREKIGYSSEMTTVAWKALPTNDAAQSAADAMLRPSASAHGAIDGAPFVSPKAEQSSTAASVGGDPALPLPVIAPQQTARSNPFRAASGARGVVVGVVVSVCAVGALIGVAIAQLVRLRLGGSGVSRWPRRVGPQ
jgi:hypothetical protein